MTRLLALAMLVILASVCLADDVSDYLTRDGTLKDELVFSVALTSNKPPTWDGTTWRVKPSGEWEGTWGRIKDPVGKGKLSEKQIQALAQSLATNEFSKLPRLLGEKGDARIQAVVSIRMGDKESSFYMTSNRYDYVGQTAEDAKNWHRFVALELLIRDMLKIKKAWPIDQDADPGKK